MLATLFVGIGTASAGTTYSIATAIPEFDPANANASNLTVATVHYKFDPAVSGTSTALIEVVDSNGQLLDIKSAVYSDIEGSATGSCTAVGGSLNTYKLSLNVTPLNGKYQGTLQLTVDAKDCAAGDVKVRFSSTTGQFVAGELVVAQATGGNVTVSMVSVPALGDNGGTVTFRVKENAAGALKDKANTIKFKFPNGFTVGSPTFTVISGKYGVSPGTALVAGDFSSTGTDGRDVKVTLASGKASTVEKIIVDVAVPVTIDESTATPGDVMVTISGESTVTNTEIKAATYGNYSVEVSAKSEKTIQAGQYDQELGKILIKESLPNSLSQNKTITFTLPDGCKWNTLPSFSASDSKNYGNFAVGTFSLVGNDKRMCKVSVNVASSGTKSPEIVFKGGSITAAADFSGDVIVKIGGSAGATGEAKIGVAVAPVTASVDKVPNVVIGQSAQVAVALTLTEAKAEAIKKSVDTCTAYTASPYSITIGNDATRSGEIVIKAPPGVRFADAPKVKVIEGDIDLGTVSYDNDARTVTIKVDSVSGKASKVEISDMKLIVDRTVPEGDIVMEIGGTALVENDQAAPAGVEWFSNKHWVTKVAVAKVVTPAPGVTKGNAVFTLGQASYTLNGSTVTMPVAPYAKNGRTYLPLRFCGNAIGIDDANIWWDSATKTATLKKDNTIVQVKLGSQALYVNGVQVSTMDVAPEAKDGYTMLPIRPVLEAFGAKVTYDAATQAISIEY